MNPKKLFISLVAFVCALIVAFTGAPVLAAICLVAIAFVLAPQTACLGANTLTNLTFTMLAQKSLEAFTAALTSFRVFSTNFSGDIVGKGDKVKVAWTAAQDAGQDWVPADGYQMQDADAEGLDITINKRKYVSWSLTTEDMANMPQLNLERFARQKGFNLAKLVYQDVLSLALQADYGAPVYTGASAGFDADVVADIEQVCDEVDWPEMERGLVLKPAYHTAIVKDDTVQGTLGVQNSNVIAMSKVPNLHNFDVYKSNLIPDNGQNLVGFAAHPDAILIAGRSLVPESEAAKKIISFQVFSDPVSGMSIVAREWFDATLDKVNRVLEFNYGRRTGNTAGLKLIASA